MSAAAACHHDRVVVPKADQVAGAKRACRNVSRRSRVWGVCTECGARVALFVSVPGGWPPAPCDTMKPAEDGSDLLVAP